MRDYFSKWHLGNHKYQYTPTFRGFQSHMGYWGGKEDYFDHTNHCKVTSDWQTSSAMT